MSVRIYFLLSFILVSILGCGTKFSQNRALASDVAEEKERFLNLITDTRISETPILDVKQFIAKLGKEKQDVLNAFYKSGYTALYEMVGRLYSYNKEAIVRLLLENGADPNLAGVEGEYPLHRIALLLGEQDIHIARDLLKHGANPNVVLNNEETLIETLVNSLGNLRDQNNQRGLQASLIRLYMSYGARATFKDVRETFKLLKPITTSGKIAHKTFLDISNNIKVAKIEIINGCHDEGGHVIHFYNYEGNTLYHYNFSKWGGRVDQAEERLCEENYAALLRQKNGANRYDRVSLKFSDTESAGPRFTLEAI